MAEKSDKGWGCGVRTLPILDHGSVFADGVQNSTLLYMHQDQVTKAPPEATVLIGDEFCPVASFAIGDPVLCFQGHPEFTPQVIAGITDLRQDDIGHDRAAKCHESLTPMKVMISANGLPLSLTMPCSKLHKPFRVISCSIF